MKLSKSLLPLLALLSIFFVCGSAKPVQPDDLPLAGQQNLSKNEPAVADITRKLGEVSPAILKQENAVPEDRFFNFILRLASRIFLPILEDLISQNISN